nr:MYG1 family protein [Candidatus Paceibacterota bacterium]
WKDPANKIDTNFFDFLNIAKDILRREIKNLRDLIEGESIVKKEVEIQAEPEILVLSQDLPWEQVMTKTKKVKIVVYPEPPSGSWCLENVRKNLGDFGSASIFFPETWRGLGNGDLVLVCGVPGAVFCHRAGFFAVHQTKEGAIEMAKIALQNSKN